MSDTESFTAKAELAPVTDEPDRRTRYVWRLFTPGGRKCFMSTTRFVVKAEARADFLEVQAAFGAATLEDVTE